MTSEKSFSLCFVVRLDSNPLFRKAAVWKMTQDDLMSAFERAIYSAFVGNLRQLLTVCRAWEDYLWAYSKGQFFLRSVNKRLGLAMFLLSEDQPQGYFTQSDR
jgi:hypothetical protein